MRHKTQRPTAADERGFTLIELLVVILIIGILAAIAIPSFLNQTEKASDAAAKELVHTMQVAAETYGTDNNGDYTGVNICGPQPVRADDPDVVGQRQRLRRSADRRRPERLHGHRGVDERRHVLDHQGERRHRPLLRPGYRPAGRLQQR